MLQGIFSRMMVSQIDVACLRIESVSFCRAEGPRRLCYFVKLDVRKYLLVFRRTVVWVMLWMSGAYMVLFSLFHEI